MVLLITIPTLIALTWLVSSTRPGKAMRATAQDRDASAMMGIDVNRTIAFTFGLGGALAGVGGVVYALYIGTTYFALGFRLGLIAFTAAVLGGIGSVPGALLGGLFLGLIEAIGPTLFLTGFGVPATNQLKDAVAFTMLVLVLVFRPSGILGERVTRSRA
jgi:branched-chain amino acid transport system permease protein